VCRFFRLLALAAALAWGISASAGAAAGRYDRALALERQGRLVAAIKTLRTAALTDAQKSHRTNLRNAVRVFSAVSVYARLQEYGQARKLLNDLISKLAPLRDASIARAAYERLARLDKLERRATDREAAALIAKARALEQRGKFGEAASTFKAVAASAPAAVSPSLRQRARLGQLRAEAAAATRGNPSFADDLWDSLRSLLLGVVKWLLIAAAIVGFVLLLVGARGVLRSRFRRRGRTTVSITDLSAEPKERNVKNHLLTSELVDEIYSAAGGSEAEGDGRAEIDEKRDLDGTALPPLRIAGGAEVIDSLISEETPVKVGPVALSPRQLIYFVQWYFRRRGDYEIIGTLRGNQTRTTLTVERKSVVEGGRVLNRWPVTYEGEDSRSKAIVDVATRMAVDLGGSYVSSNWQSFREYRVAMGELAKASGSERSEALEAARASLQRALDHDPLNLLARFGLGSVLRMMGRNDESIANYRQLERAVIDSGGTSKTAKDFISRHPELIYVAMYNRAVTLSKLPRWDCQHSARETLALLVARLSTTHDILTLEHDKRQLTVKSGESPQQVTPEQQPLQETDRQKKELTAKLKQLLPGMSESPQQETPEQQLEKTDGKQQPTELSALQQVTLEQQPLEDTDRQRLELLGRAAWASTLVFLAEHTQTTDYDETNRGKQRREFLLSKIEEVRDCIKQQSGKKSDDPRIATAARQAEATVDNAYGRVLYLIGRLEEASDAIQNALAMLPDLSDAHVNMASVRMAKRTGDTGWQSDAESDLKRALEMSPNDEKALLLLGDLYADPAVRRFTEAATCYAQLRADPIATFKLGELHRREGKLNEAVDLFSRSLSQLPAADYRADRYVETVLLVERDKITDEQLGDALAYAERLANHGTPARLRKHGRDFVEQIEKIITARRKAILRRSKPRRTAKPRAAATRTKKQTAD
jgi:tetratricopeptide (TPR) repeat protein